jgi:hypothetical protein
MLKLGVLAWLMAVAFGATNQFIGSLNGLNFPFPINVCSKSLLTSTTTSIKYVCSSDKTSVVAYEYSDATCTTVSKNTTYFAIPSKGFGSFECNGNDYYATVNVYFSCAGDKIATTYYAVDVCYYATSGNYSLASCTEESATVNTYAANDTTCSNSTIQSPLVAPSECGVEFTKVGITPVYAELTKCMNGDSSAAYIPSIMGAIILLVLNIVNLL